jgi:hypothetical protein
VTTSASHVDARERAPSRSLRAKRSASSRSTNVVRTLSTAEAPSVAWAPCSGAGLVGPRPCTPSTGQVTSGPRRGRPGPRTTPGTSGSRHQGARGSRTAPGPGAPAPATNKQSERGGRQKRHERRESRGRNCESPRNSANLEDAPCRTAVDPQRLVQCPVKRGPVVPELLPEPLLCLSIDEVGRRGVGILLPLLQARCGSSAR